MKEEWKEETCEQALATEWSWGRRVMKENGISGPETSKSVEAESKKECKDE